MQYSLALTILLMGLAGGPHCVAMCGAACAGIRNGHGNIRYRHRSFITRRPPALR